MSLSFMQNWASTWTVMATRCADCTSGGNCETNPSIIAALTCWINSHSGLGTRRLSRTSVHPAGRSSRPSSAWNRSPGVTTPERAHSYSYLLSLLILFSIEWNGRRCLPGPGIRHGKLG